MKITTMNTLPIELIDNINNTFCNPPTCSEILKLEIESHYDRIHLMSIEDALRTNQSAYTVFLCYARWYMFAENKVNYKFETHLIDNELYEKIVKYNRYDIVKELEKHIITHLHELYTKIERPYQIYTTNELNEIVLVKYRYDLVLTGLSLGSMNFIQQIINNIYPEVWEDYYAEDQHRLVSCFWYRKADDPDLVKILDWMVEVGYQPFPEDFRGMNKGVVDWYRQFKKARREKSKQLQVRSKQL